MKKTKAFTLIETLIVIVVFCIGILTILIGLSQTLRNKEYANTQIQSAFFAREGIELVFNLRDANYHKELPWNCIFEYSSKPITITFDEYGNETKNTICNGYFGAGNVLKLDIGSGNDYINITIESEEIGDLDKDEDFDKVFNKYQIYKHIDEDTFLYNHTEKDGEATGFARYIVIKTVEGVNSDDNLLKIESHVLYKKGIFKGEKVMETFIGNYEFNE